MKVVSCSSRTAPGVLSWAAWDALRTGPVLVASADHPQLPHLAAAGIAWTVADAPPAGADVVWLATDEHDPLLRAEGVELVAGSWDLPGARLLDVVAVMDRLRSPGGCPWDAQQTHASLMPYLLEEAYETYEALENGDLGHLREELGDLLLQITFHARIAGETPDTGWDIDDVADDLVDKLVRRHPHVFAGASADDLEGSWEVLKAAEKGRTSVTEGIPLGQPALSLAAKLQRRAAKLGVPPVAYQGVGGGLWALVERCRADGLDPEAELRAVARRFRDRLAELEAEGAPATEQGWRDTWS